MAEPNRSRAGKGRPAGRKMKDDSALLSSLKKDLRTRLRARLGDIPAPRRERDSAQARALLARQRVWREARAVLFYLPRADELDFLPLLEQALAEGKTAALPRFIPETGRYAACQIENLARDCAPGKFGIPEPGAGRPDFPAEPSGLGAGSWCRL